MAHSPEHSLNWEEIPGWFRWRSGQEEAVAWFPDGSRFVEVGVYLGRSICSLAQLAEAGGKRFSLIGVDTCRGSGPEGPAGRDVHAAAVAEGGGTFAGSLHRNVIACGYDASIALIVADSVTASSFFQDRSLAWVHIDAQHDYEGVKRDIAAWLPKVGLGGWLSGDDYEDWWADVVRAVDESLPDAEPWSTKQWRVRL